MLRDVDLQTTNDNKRGDDAHKVPGSLIPESVFDALPMMSRLLHFDESQ
jgi:hypothetical protein